MKSVLTAAFLLCAAASASAAKFTVDELVDRANKALRGDSSHARLTMTIQTPDWTRTMDVEGWNKKRTMAFIVIRAPAKDRGETTLRRGDEMWLWLPKVERAIKIPPTMMHSAWEGSDFTYEDIVKADSIVKDYTHKLLSTRKEKDRVVYRIESIPKPDAPVVWGKVISEAAVYDADDSVVPLKEEDYSERGELIRTMTLSDIKMMGGRRVPLRLECVPAKKPGKKTVLLYKELDFDIPLKDSFFSYQRLQRGGR
ncbi:MAG: outer membrane lipoprotein-sorting protein [Elusimicrobia bacterium]|nr:outer membrane lipoprotein-sorting protein [Elusimicrobiota bacterium]